jgi:predicted RNA-binding Zn ribbon-like protein
MLPDPGDRSPAPEPLRALQLFVNTLDTENGIEELTEPEALRHVLAAANVLAPDTELTEAGLTRAIGVREAFRALLLANNGVPLDPARVAPLQRAARAARLTLQIDGGGRPLLVPSADGLDGALGRLLAILHEAALDGSLVRLKACCRDVCHWVFYDRSRNGSSKWCATSVCGNRTNTKAYRARVRKTTPRDA